MAESAAFHSYIDRIIGKPKWGTLRQGTIFSGARADGYEGQAVYGVVITAHCDLVHGKVPVINYLPAVHIEDWLKRDFASLFTQYMLAEVRSKIKNLLGELNLSPTLLETHTVTEIAEKQLRPNYDQSRVRKLGEKIEAAGQNLSWLKDRFPVDNLDSSEFRTLREMNPKACEGQLDRCLRQENSDFYFLPSVEAGTVGSPCIVLLRNIGHLSSVVGDRLASGISRTELEQLEKEGSDTRASSELGVEAAEGEFAMPVGRIKSPHLEHLMQAFSTLYTRIGVEDIGAEHVDRLKSRYMEEE